MSFTFYVACLWASGRSKGRSPPMACLSRVRPGKWAFSTVSLVSIPVLCSWMLGSNCTRQRFDDTCIPLRLVQGIPFICGVCMERWLGVPLRARCWQQQVTVTPDPGRSQAGPKQSLLLSPRVTLIQRTRRFTAWTWVYWGGQINALGENFISPSLKNHCLYLLFLLICLPCCMGPISSCKHSTIQGRLPKWYHKI